MFFGKTNFGHPSDFEKIHKTNPRLIYVSISGFGQTGPYSQRPAYDVIIQAMSGIASITGVEGQPPIRVGSSIGDLSAALYGVIGITAALARAKETGTGQHIDVSMLDCQIALLENAIARYDVTSAVPGPLGSRHPAITPFQFFEASDGYLVIAAGNDRLWHSLCDTVGAPKLIEDDRFATNDLRTKNHAELEAILGALFSRRTVSEWLALFEAAGIPSGPIQNIEQVAADPHVAYRQMIKRQSMPTVKASVAVPASPLKFSDEDCIMNPRPAPDLGEHTNEVLKKVAGITDDELVTLRADGVIG